MQSAFLLVNSTACRYRLMVRTPGFQPDNRGSIPRSGTKKKTPILVSFLVYLELTLRRIEMVLTKIEYYCIVR